MDEIWFADRLHLLKAVTSKYTKPEVVFSGRGRHIQKWLLRHISAVGAPILTKFGSLMQNADYGELVEIETVSRISIWRTSVFRNRK